MPKKYSDVFGALFYPSISPDVVPSEKLEGVSFLQYRFTPRRRVSSGRKNLVFDPNVKNLVFTLTNLIKECKSLAFVTPFVGEKSLYAGPDDPDFKFLNLSTEQLSILNTLQFDSYKSKTIRTVQGETYQSVLFHPLKDTSYSAISNADAIVALSRHTEKLLISVVPKYLPSWFRANYKYEPKQTVRVNYENFLGSLIQEDNLFKCDHNGDHPLKWRFFLWVLQYHTTVDKRTTMFSEISRIPLKFSRVSISELRSFLGTDMKRFEAYRNIAKTNPNLSISRSDFDDPRWHRRLVKDLRQLHDANYAADDDDFEEVFDKYDCAD